MAQINLTSTASGSISTPDSGVVSIFSNTSDSGNLYLKLSDGTFVAIGSGGGGGSGSSGTSGTTGASGASGSSGSSGTSGSGSSGTSGTGGNGSSGTSGTGSDGADGSSGTSGTGGSGSSGTSGTGGAGADGSSGTSGTGGQGPAGSSGTSGTGGNGSSGTSGTAGAQGAPGDAGSSGTSGTGGQGPAGSSGTSGTGGAGADGSSGTSGTTGAAGAPGDAGSSGTSGTGGAGSSGTSGTGGSGSSGTSGTGSDGSAGTSGTTGAAGAAGSSGTSGTGGGGGGGISTVFSSTNRYAYTSGSDQLTILSSGTVYGGLTWSRSSTTLTVTSPSHGLTTSDYVLIRNMNQDYLHVQVASTSGTDTFTVTCSDTGGTSGTEGAYMPCFRMGSYTDSDITFTAPSAGNAQLISCVMFFNSPENNPTLTVPASGLSNGAGINSSLATKMFPTIQAFYDNGSELVAISTFGQTALNNGDYNKITFANADQFANTWIKVTF